MPHDGKIKIALRRGEPLTGHFWPQDDGEPVPGLLRWTTEGGARLELIEPPKGWRGQLGGPPFTLHAELSHGEQLTLIDAWVIRVELGDRIAALHAPTVAIGAQTRPEARWPTAIYSTANLSEWWVDTGLRYQHRVDPKSPVQIRVEREQPKVEHVALPRASLRFEFPAESAVAYGPDWSISTWLDLAVKPKRKFTLQAAHRDYAQPLLAFTHFASDRPDALTREILVDADSQERIEVLRQGPSIEPRDWRPGRGNGYLFQRSDLPDLTKAIRRWWKLHELVAPALGLFAEHITAGNSFSPSRLLTLYASMERYAKVRFGAKKEFQNLRKYGDASSQITGCNNAALTLLGVSRSYFAHAEDPGSKFSVAEIEDSILDSTRRASALVQSCLLRELKVPKGSREQLLLDHYRSWPIPAGKQPALNGD